VCVGAWILSRTVGLAGPLAGVEPVGAADLAAALLAVLACGAAFAAWAGGTRTAVRLDVPVLVISVVAVLALVAPAMAAHHVHDDAAGGVHTHGASETAAAAPHSHDGVAAAAGHDAEPIVTLGDARLADTQRNAAIALLVSTRAALLARFPDRASVEAAGYQWIGDGRKVGGYEHFVQSDYMSDGRELDPDHIESIVLQRQADGSERIVTAMYVLERGKTMADAPDIAGSLTPWHDHQNLCWDGDGKIVGLVVNGQCRPGGTFRPTPPMMHVWLTDPPCGPFTGVEGHGAENCAHSHGAA
jgi:hypothetical protein